MRLLVRAVAVGGVVCVVRRAVDGKAAPAVIEADDILRLDLVGGADRDPAHGDGSLGGQRDVALACQRLAPQYWSTYFCIVRRMKREESSARSSQAKTQAVMMPSKPTSCRVPKKTSQSTSPWPSPSSRAG
jgi:hypothetical protein